MACAIYSSARVRPLDYKNHLFTTTFGAACHHLPVGGVRVHISEMQLGIVTFFFFLFSLFYSRNPCQPFAKNWICPSVSFSINFGSYFFIVISFTFNAFFKKKNFINWHFISFSFLSNLVLVLVIVFFFFVFYPFIAFFSTSSLNILLHLIVLIQFWFSLFWLLFSYTFLDLLLFLFCLILLNLLF